MIALVPSIVAAGALAWWITRRDAWPVMAVALQISFHLLWAAILVADLELDRDAAGPVASGLGVVMVVLISLLLRLLQRRPR